MLQSDYVIGLNGIGLFIHDTIQINDAVFDFQSLTGQSHAAFHVVLATVNRTGYYLAEYLLVLEYLLAAYLIVEIIDTALLECGE